jgi:hypothetical protein
MCVEGCGSQRCNEYNVGETYSSLRDVCVDDDSNRSRNGVTIMSIVRRNDTQRCLMCKMASRPWGDRG